MKIGTVVVYRTRKKRDRGGQQYELVAFLPHSRRDGSQGELAIWQSQCRRCGETFTCATPSWNGEPKISAFVRHCPKHRRPEHRLLSGEASS